MVAFDNFDLFVSTPNGKDTMHETVEIGIQTIPKIYIAWGNERFDT